ncbi:MAG: hypothetical protein V1709_07715 [Planctomycetota bacterium]
MPIEPISEINILEPLLVLSKKYYAGGEVVIEFITPENKEINSHVEITFKKSEDVFKLGQKYRVTFTQIVEQET